MSKLVQATRAPGKIQLRRVARGISIANGIGFLCATAVPTYVDARVDHSVYGVREYFLGPWIWLGALVVFTFTMGLFAWSRRSEKHGNRIASLGSWLPLASIGAASLFNFGPEFPHQHIVTYVVLFSFTSSVYWLIARFGWGDLDKLDSASEKSRDRMLGQRIEFYRMFFFGLGLAVVGIMFGWIDFLRRFSTDMFAIAGHQQIYLVNRPGFSGGRIT